jgi:uncharacterized protein YprB with RNaseH-like and TPR domain
MKKNKPGSMETYRLIAQLPKMEITKLARSTCKHGHSYLAHPCCAFDEGVVVLKDGKKIALTEKVGFLDIETFTFNFKADMGFMMTYCIKDEDGKVHTNSVTAKELKQSKDWDKRLMQDCIKDMNKYTRLIGHYSTMFDIPFLRTRALYYNLDFPVYKEIYHTDTYFLLRGKFKIRSNSLKWACKFFGIPAKDTPFEFDTWYNAAKGDKKALAEVLQHNIEDVISTELLYKKVNRFSMINKRSI